jgi:hypothetical protein
MRVSLIIKRQWFDEIRAGRKKKEYRDITKRNASLLCYVGENDTFLGFKPITEIMFYNGYNKNRPSMLVECTGIAIETDKDDQGEYEIFVLSIGKILEVENC